MLSYFYTFDTNVFPITVYAISFTTIDDIEINNILNICIVLENVRSSSKFLLSHHKS